MIDDINKGKLIKVVKLTRKNPENYKEVCLKKAQKFNKKVFIEKIKKEIIEK